MSARRKALCTTEPAILNFTVQGQANSGTSGAPISSDSAANTTAEKTTLRRQLRHARRQLSRPQQRQHSRIICQRLCRLKSYRSARSIALYIANDGEVDTQPLISAALKDGKTVFLPIVGDNFSLNFQPYRQGHALRRNRYGISEPYIRRRKNISLREIDLVILPLVGFDANRHRLGMGGGYYDRALAFTKTSFASGPALIAIAHQLQLCSALKVEAWDVSLQQVITEKTSYR